MNDQNTVETPKAHPFARTLGEGPYKYVGFFDLGRVIGALHAGNVNGYNNGLAMAPKVEAGMGTCAHCGQPILNICIVRIGNGKLYGVGSECIFKTGLPHVELTKVQKAIKAHQKAQRDARLAKKGDAARAELAKLLETHKDQMLAQTIGSQNLYSYVTWCLKRSTHGGVLIVLKKAKYLLGVL